MIVADTNLIAHLVVESEGTPAAEAVFTKDPDWVAPLLWRYEMQNLLATRMRVLGASLAESLAAYERAGGLVRTLSTAAGAESVLTVAAEIRISAYDAEFLALARLLRVPLVTSDRKVLVASPRHAVAPEQFAPSTLATAGDARLRP